MFDFLTINWDKLNSPAEIGVLILGVVAVGVAIYYLFSRQATKVIADNNTATINSYKERLAIVEEETKSCHDQHKETQKEQAKLQGQLDVLKEVPLNGIHQRLDSIDTTLKQLGNRRKKV